jgi:hypothetical protein
MKSKIYLLLLFVFTCNALFAQKKIFTVYDSTTSSIIPYANIWKENKIYANADANGKFCIEEDDVKNSFTITCIGYLTTPIDLNSSIIHLDKEKVNLREVVILSPKRKQKIQLGKLSGTNRWLTATYDLTISEIGKSFSTNKEKQFYLQEVEFKTATYQEGRKMGINIYTLDEKGKPDQLISSENIILTLKNGTSITTYNFEDNLIPIPKNGFFVSAQILLVEENKQYGTSGKLTDWFFYDPAIGANKGVEDAFYFTKTEEGTWQKIPNYDLNIKVFLTD